MKIKSALKPKRVAWAIGALVGALMVNLVAHSSAKAFRTDWRFCCGRFSIVGIVCHRGTRRSNAPRVVIPRSDATTLVSHRGGARLGRSRASLAC
jgi:hypothetical protein